MIHIKPLGFRSYYKALALLQLFPELGLLHQTLKQWPVIFSAFQWLGRILPASLRFFPAVYVAVSRQEVLGLIWLKRDSGQSSRWRISGVAIHPDAATYDVGTQLVNFAINRHGAEGVQTFVANVPSANTEALALYKSCGFRQAARCHVFTADITAANCLPEQQCLTPELRGLRESSIKDCHKLKVLREEILPVEARLSLAPSDKTFGFRPFRWLAKRVKGQFSRRWVIDEPVHDSLMGMVSFSTDNHKDFDVVVWVHPGWSQCYHNLLNFVLSKVCMNASSPKVRVVCYGFEKDVLAYLEKSEFKRCHEVEVLVKDYWVPLDKQKPALADSVLLFGGRNPSTAMLGK